MSITTNNNFKAASPVRRTLNWLGSAYKRLSLSMLLSFMLHISLVAAVVLIILYLNVEEPRSQQQEVSVSLISEAELDTTFSYHDKDNSQSFPEPPENSLPTIAETLEREIRREHDRELEPLVEEIEQAATVEARKKAEEKIEELEKEYARRLDERVEIIADQLARSSQEVAKLREKAAAVIQDIAKSKQRKERWARWTILHGGYLGLDRAGGRLVVMDYPQAGKYTYIVNLNGAPRLQSGSKPDGYLFVSVGTMGLARDIAKCREAGVRLGASEFLPYVVFPTQLENNLVTLERQEMSKRGISNETRVQSTLFRLQDDGRVYLVDISVQ